MTLADKGKTNPYQSRDGLVSLIISKIHVHPLTAVREMVANSRDQYVAVPTKEPHILIELDPEHKRFNHIDNATGIENLDDFCYVGNEAIEGMGKSVGDRVNLPTKIDPEIGGQYHIAKMSYIDCSNAEEDKVRIYSNNGKDGDILTMRQFGWGEPEHFKSPRNTLALEHIGLRVEVLDAKESLLSVKKLLPYLEEKFGILTHRKKLVIEIQDKANDKTYRVNKPSWLKTDNEIRIHPLLKLRSGSYITGRFDHIAKAPKGDNVYVFVKYVGICSVQVPYLVSGWINCDDLTNAIDLSRDRFLTTSAIYQEVMDKLEYYLEKEGYEKQIITADTSFKATKQMNEIANMALKAVAKQLEELNLTGISGDLEGASGDGDKIQIDVNVEKREPSDIKHPKKPGENKPPKGTRNPKTTHKVKKWADADERQPNVQIRASEEGKNMPTMFYKKPEDLVINTDQEDSGMMIRTSGPTKLVAMIPFVAEATIELMGKTVTLSPEAWKEEYRKLRKKLWMES